MTYAERIQQRLTEGLAPEQLQIEDESHKHKGHVGARPEGETHFHVRVVSVAFEGQNRVTRQRSVYRLLKAEMDERVHALALETLTPTEAASQARP
ncbi:MAG: BolA family transcriptional regulator [Minwuia sp.]|nr:BolA family transcriptional regulator [Minwuia sp.]